MRNPEREFRFYVHLGHWRDRGYELGTVDCVNFTCSWVDNELGTSYLSQVREQIKYSVDLGILRTINKNGGYRKLVEQYCGPGISRDETWEVGDVALFTNGYGVEALGLLGERLVYAPDDTGLVAFDSYRVITFWRLSCLKQQPQ